MDVVRGLRIPVAAIAAVVPCIVYATNGMNLEGYGPEALGVGGASMAYDNGTAAVMNNPSTIGLMKDGHRSDFALGVLGPNVESKNSFGSEKSSGDAYYMPALGWVSKRNQLAYGVALFAQGGMGAEYDGGSAVDQSGPLGVNFGGAQNTDSHKQRSELGVGRLMVPLAYNVNERFTIGGSVDLVWGGLDIMWSMDARNFLGGLDGSKIDDGGSGKAAILGALIGGQNDRASISGTMADTFVKNFDTTGGVGTPNGAFNNFYWGNFDFSDGSGFTQQTRGTGFGGKIGFVFRANEQVTIGGTYHSKTAMSDFKGDVDLSWKVDTTSAAGSQTGAVISFPGTVKVKDFQWPATYGLGVAVQATPTIMLVADWKRLNWSDVMDEFHMVITADSNLTGLASSFSDTVLDFHYPQKWDDQNVFELGGAFDVTPNVTLRAGYNHASNPVPNKYVSFLFPATVENHYTAGVGYGINDVSSVDFALSYAPEVKVTESNTESNNLGTTSATTISHSQVNWQLMYTYKY